MFRVYYISDMWYLNKQQQKTGWSIELENRKGKKSMNCILFCVFHSFIIYSWFEFSFMDTLISKHIYSESLSLYKSKSATKLNAKKAILLNISEVQNIKTKNFGK